MKVYIRNVQYVENLEPIESFASTGIDSNSHTCYAVNPDSGRIGDPYFKVYDNISHQKATHVARISFFDPIYFIHTDGSGKQPWYLNSKEKKKMIKFLDKKSLIVNTTTWMYTKYTWNFEYGFFNLVPYDTIKYNNMLDAYIDGFYDVDRNLEHSSYVPSTLDRPDYMLL